MCVFDWVGVDTCVVLVYYCNTLVRRNFIDPSNTLLMTELNHRSSIILTTQPWFLLQQTSVDGSWFISDLRQPLGHLSNRHDNFAKSSTRSLIMNSVHCDSVLLMLGSSSAWPHTRFWQLISHNRIVFTLQTSHDGIFFLLTSNINLMFTLAPDF